MTDDIKQKIIEYKSKLENIISLVEELSKIKWSDDTAKKYCEEQGLQITESMVNQLTSSPMIITNLSNFKYDYLKEKLNIFKSQSEKLLDNTGWNEYNETYKTYIKNFVDKINQQLTNFAISLQNQHQFVNYLSNLFNQFNNLQTTLNPNLNELFEHFKYGNKNYVIFGKNGSGKTTLLKKISSEIFQNSSVVIPANRNIEVQQQGYNLSISTNQTLNNTLSNSNAMTQLTYLLNNGTLDEYENDKNRKDVLRTRFYKIFSELDLGRTINIEQINLFLTPENSSSKYHIHTGSDGERSIAYLIMAILLAPQNSFVFIDEPERHLNGALMRNLFDKLESERPDLRFVYLTHITDFVESRKNVELVYLEKTNIYQTWSFKKIEDFSDISLDVILSIEGTKDDIIFCEGDRSSIDCQILDCLYPECEIKPVGSCEQVKLNTKGINGKENIFRRKAYGLIDNDYMSLDEINALKADNVLTIGYNEWENLLISSEILEKVKSSFLPKNLAPLKIDVINHIKNSGKNAILSDFITKRYTKIILADKLIYGEDLPTQIDAHNANNRKALIDEVHKLEQKISKGTDYDELISIVPAKMLLSKIAQGLGFSKGTDYVDWVVKLLKKDEAFNNLVKSKLKIVFK
jgi:ABC-type cobalamin/Fe3+-siderophores transport system ATPase subunit